LDTLKGRVSRTILKETTMAIHLLPLAKLALMAGKAGTSKAAGTAVARQAASIAARGKPPGWLVKGALAGLIGFKLLFLLVLASKRNLFHSPAEVGHACDHCGHFVNLNEISRSFNPRLVDKEFIFSGKCPACGKVLAIRDSRLKPDG
jgi:hypothetical protein